MRLESDSDTVHFKIVYWGPNYAGNQDWLKLLHRRLPPSSRGELERLREGVNDRGVPSRDELLFAVDLSTRARGRAVHAQLHTIAGPPLNPSVYTSALEDVDGLVLLVDLAWYHNAMIVTELHEWLDAIGRDPGELPTAVQYLNAEPHRARARQQLEPELTRARWPSFAAPPYRRDNVLGSTRAVLRELVTRYRAASEA